MAWQSTIYDWFGAKSQNNLFGVVVGGVIGIIGGIVVLIAGAIGRWWTNRRRIKARLTALAVELDYLRETVIEIKRGFQNRRGSSKRLNIDLLESVRLAGYELDSREDFTKALAQVYRDVVHTNDRLDDIPMLSVKVPFQNDEARSAFEGYARQIAAAMASLDGVEESIVNLRGKIKVKTNTEFPTFKPTYSAGAAKARKGPKISDARAEDQTNQSV